MNAKPSSSSSSVVDKVMSQIKIISSGSSSDNNDPGLGSEINTVVQAVDQSAYTELIELTQRKFLRQMAIFTDTASSRPFPRLFTLDFDSDSSSSSTRFCLRALCECDSGWHTTGSSISYELLTDIPDTHYAYLIRILSLVKHSTMNLNILRSSKTFEDVLTYIEDNLEDLGKKAASGTRSRQLDQMFNFRESYNAVKMYVISKLVSNESARRSGGGNGSDEVDNPNRIESLQLSRCAMPSGKVAWLCDEHSKEQYVQMLTSVESSAGGQFQNDEYSAILLEELKKYNKN